jgi:hypothetical protein
LKLSCFLLFQRNETAPEKYPCLSEKPLKNTKENVSRTERTWWKIS